MAVVAGVSIHSHDLTIVVDLRSKGAIVCRGVGSAARSRIPNSFYGERTKGRDCRAAETQRIAENAPRWRDMNLAAERASEAPYCGVDLGYPIRGEPARSMAGSRCLLPPQGRRDDRVPRALCVRLR